MSGTLGQGTASAQQTSGGIYEVTIIPRQGTDIVWRNRSYIGALNISTAGGNLVLVEEVSLDGYWRGIHEVPPSWPDETLAAKVVAARTYLTWTMARGRSSSG